MASFSAFSRAKAALMRKVPTPLLAFLLLALAPVPALASATAGASAPPPRLLAERGFIVWDPASSREHLLFTAEIENTRGPAALIVETPLVPVLDAVDDDLALALERLFAMHGERAEVSFEAFPTTQKRGEARILQAADAGSLGGYLESKNLVAYPGLFSFARDFGGRAFHYAALEVPEAEDGHRVLAWTAISMTTPRPFYPLATPDESRTPEGRASNLSVYTLSPELLALTIGEFDTGTPVRIERADLEGALGDALLSALGLDSIEGPLWLQRFEPSRMPIGAEDGFFVRVPEPSPKTLPEEASALSATRNAKRLLLLATAVAFAVAIAWAGSWERQRLRQ